LDEDTKVVKQD